MSISKLIRMDIFFYLAYSEIKASRRSVSVAVLAVSLGWRHDNVSVQEASRRHSGLKIGGITAAVALGYARREARVG